MKCPKCGYLGFEPVERCRNCGYEFSLTGPSPAPDLSLRAADADDVRPLDDLVLVDRASAPPLENAPPSDVYGERAPKEAIAEGELTLFGTAPDDAPLITRASAPRTPLSVRRSTPEVPRLRTERRAPVVEVPLPGLDLPSPPPVAPAPMKLSVADTRPDESVRYVDAEPAGAGGRLMAATIDLALLGAIDVLVIYLTLKICGLAPNELSMIPIAPIGLFLAAQNLGYFVAFTSGGQTLGKMAAGIKVVLQDDDRAPGLSSAMRRTFIWILLAIPAGLGFLTMLGADGRGLHDRAAGTRVIRAI